MRPAAGSAAAIVWGRGGPYVVLAKCPATVASDNPPCVAVPGWSSCQRPAAPLHGHAPVAQLDRAPDYGSGG
jgi:hypothetical protein